MFREFVNIFMLLSNRISKSNLSKNMNQMHHQSVLLNSQVNVIVPYLFCVFSESIASVQ